MVWTDVIQVALLLGGGFFTIGYVAWATGTNLFDWMEVVNARDNESFTFFSPDPTLPATVVTFTLTDALWIVVAHCANQMTMQRYFSTVNVEASKRSFVTGAVTGVVIILVLTIVGASLVYYFTQGPEPLPGHIDLGQRQGPRQHLPLLRGLPGPGRPWPAPSSPRCWRPPCSTIDSGVNSFATVATVDFGRLRKKKKPIDEVRQARIITLAVGLAVTVGALSLDNFTGSDDILTILPKTFQRPGRSHGRAVPGRDVSPPGPGSEPSGPRPSSASRRPCWSRIPSLCSSLSARRPSRPWWRCWETASVRG